MLTQWFQQKLKSPLINCNIVPEQSTVSMYEDRPIVAMEQIGYVAQIGAQRLDGVVTDLKARKEIVTHEKGVPGQYAGQFVTFGFSKFDQCRNSSPMIESGVGAARKGNQSVSLG